MKPFCLPTLVATLLLLAGSTAAGTAPLKRHPQPLNLGNQTVTAQVPDGYTLEVLNTTMETPRLMRFLPNGDLLVGSRSNRVYRLAPPYRHAEVLFSLRGYPHSIAWRQGELLVARTDGLYHVPYRLGQAHVDPDDITLLARLPGGRGHNSRSVAVGPDGRIYVSLGISSNCSNQYLGPPYRFEDRRGGLLVLDETTNPPRWEPYASGLRNPVGFDWQPGTGVIYASNNGPDHWGFDEPPEYFSRLTEGSFHGMPWFQWVNGKVTRDDCIETPPPRPAGEVTPPVATFPARNAPMGVAFVPPGAMDKGLEGDAVVALHGSWGTAPTGSAYGPPSSRRPPALVAVRFDHHKAVRVDKLVTGFQLANGSRWARPVGVAVGHDGSLYFTSDAGVMGLLRLKRNSK